MDKEEVIYFLVLISCLVVAICCFAYAVEKDKKIEQLCEHEYVVRNNDSLTLSLYLTNKVWIPITTIECIKCGNRR